MSEKTQLAIDFLKTLLHVNTDNSFEDALKLTRDETKLRMSKK